MGRGTSSASRASRWPSDARDGRPRVVIVSGVHLYREGLAASLVRDGRLEIVAKAGAADAVTSVARFVPDAVLVDASLEGGLTLARAIRATAPSVRLIGFGISGGSSSFVACAEAGFSAFVDCEGTITNLVDAVFAALRGELSCSPELAAMMCSRLASLAGPRPMAGSELTPREREVAALVIEGRSNKEIAIDLKIGPATVKNHVHNILDKLSIRRRAAIASRLDDKARERREGAGRANAGLILGRPSFGAAGNPSDGLS